MELSLTRAKAKFFEATGDERAIQNEHRKLLSAHLDDRILHGDREVIYIVPETLTGAFPLFDVAEQALLLVRQCRRGGLTAKLICTNPYTLHISGWCDERELLEPPPQPKTKVKKKTTAAKKTPPPPSDELSRMAQRGEFSARLKQVAAKYSSAAGTRR